MSCKKPSAESLAEIALIPTTFISACNASTPRLKAHKLPLWRWQTDRAEEHGRTRTAASGAGRNKLRQVGIATPGDSVQRTAGIP